MDIQHLIKMANNIGSFFEAEPDKAEAVKGVADHIKNFWDPRMRRQIFNYLDEHEGAGLSEIALNALRTHRQRLVGGFEGSNSQKGAKGKREE
jgi:formate dehydrogenase subunit delta